MIGTIRKLLRDRKNARRVSRDNARDALLKTAEGRDEYIDQLAAECEKSSLIALLEDALTHRGDIVECGVFRGDSLRGVWIGGLSTSQLVSIPLAVIAIALLWRLRHHDERPDAAPEPDAEG